MLLTGQESWKSQQLTKHRSLCLSVYHQPPEKENRYKLYSHSNTNLFSYALIWSTRTAERARPAHITHSFYL